MPTLYELLGVPEQATAAELRQAYRQLVLLTHPDRTPDPAAHQRFLVITEAYDILSQPARRQAYDALLRAQRQPAPAPPPPLHRDPALRRQGRPAPARRAPAPRPDEYAPHARQGRWVCRVLLAFCALLLLDFCWTLDYPREVIQTAERHDVSSRRSGSVVYYLIRTPHATFRNYTYDLRPGMEIAVRRSALLRQTRQVALPGRPPDRADEASVYGNFLFAPLVLAVVAGLGARRRSSPALAVNCAVTGGLLWLVVGYFLLAS